jgi:hypothetical protein
MRDSISGVVFSIDRERGKIRRKKMKNQQARKLCRQEKKPGKTTKPREGRQIFWKD